MRTHTTNYKETIKRMGREIDAVIEYSLNGANVSLTAEDLNSITPAFHSSLLKTAMKELTIDSNIEIPKETVIKLKFGAKVGGSYEMLDFGNYVVNKIERKEDTRSYEITCYDKMIYTMVDYTTPDGVEFPITVREYIKAIANSVGLQFKNENDTFTNYDRQIQTDLYEGLGYTKRDVLDELSAVTGSIICLDKDDKIEIRKITETTDIIDEEFLKDINVNFGEKYGPINSVVLSRSGESDNIYRKNQESIDAHGLCEIKIKDNQIMNDNNRADYLDELLEALDGIEYYINDYTSTGITYYEIGDRYTVTVDGKSYSCVAFNDEIEITQGIVENLYTDRPEESETDYKKADTTDRRINKAYIIVDKQQQRIDSIVSTIEAVEGLPNEFQEFKTEQIQTNSGITQSISQIQSKLDEDITELKNTLVTIDINGISVTTNTSAISTLMTNDKFAIVMQGGRELAFIGYDYNLKETVSRMHNLTVETYLTSGSHRRQKFGINRTGEFYIGG